MRRPTTLTNEELERLEWCRAVLDDEQMCDCDEEAALIAFRRANAAQAYEQLLSLLVKLKMQEHHLDTSTLDKNRRN